MDKIRVVCVTKSGNAVSQSGVNKIYTALFGKEKNHEIEVVSGTKLLEPNYLMNILEEDPVLVVHDTDNKRLWIIPDNIRFDIMTKMKFSDINNSFDFIIDFISHIEK